MAMAIVVMMMLMVVGDDDGSKLTCQQPPDAMAAFWHRSLFGTHTQMIRFFRGKHPSSTSLWPGLHWCMRTAVLACRLLAEKNSIEYEGETNG